MAYSTLKRASSGRRRKYGSGWRNAWSVAAFARSMVSSLWLKRTTLILRKNDKLLI